MSNQHVPEYKIGLLKGIIKSVGQAFGLWSRWPRPVKADNKEKQPMKIKLKGKSS